MEDRFIKPVWEHATSRYQCVTPGLVDELQTDFFAGRELGSRVSGIGPEMAAVIVAETLEADRIINLPPEQFLSGAAKSNQMSDFKRAVMAEILFSVFEEAQKTGDKESEQTYWVLAMASLEEILRSPVASPLLWYEDIFWDVAEAIPESDKDEAIYWFKCGLAHNLYHNNGNNAIPFLRDIATTHLAMKDLDQGLMIFTALLRHDPSEIWTYNEMAISFKDHSLTRLGAEAAQRGLDLISTKGDPERLRQQLKDCLHALHTSKFQGREAMVAPSVLADLSAALALGFDNGTNRPLGVLCRSVVPDLDQMPVKQPMKPPDFPLPNRESSLKQLVSLAATPWPEGSEGQGSESKNKRKRHKHKS